MIRPPFGGDGREGATPPVKNPNTTAKNHPTRPGIPCSIRDHPRFTCALAAGDITCENTWRQVRPRSRASGHHWHRSPSRTADRHRAESQALGLLRRRLRFTGWPGHYELAGSYSVREPRYPPRLPQPQPAPHAIRETPLASYPPMHPGLHMS